MDKKLIYLTGGKFNRRKLVSYSNNTRATPQKVRLAVFNSLYNIYGTVLDLFAGSGAYAFEAISRGAEYAYLNDNDQFAIKSLKENISTLNIEAFVKVTKLNYLKVLDYYKENNILFNLVFIDPPYKFTDLELIDVFNWLNETQKKGLRIVLERTSSASPLNISGLTLIFDKKYGSKRVFIYQKD